MTKRFFTLWILLMGFWTTAAMAQLEEISQLKITPEESKRLLDLLNKPVDPGALNSTKSELLRQKSMAARLLGDTVNEEKWLRERRLIGLAKNSPEKSPGHRPVPMHT